jgi:hypothetical protein
MAWNGKAWKFIACGVLSPLELSPSELLSLVSCHPKSCRPQSCLTIVVEGIIFSLSLTPPNRDFTGCAASLVFATRASALAFVTKAGFPGIYIHGQRICVTWDRNIRRPLSLGLAALCSSLSNLPPPLACWQNCRGCLHHLYPPSEVRPTAEEHLPRDGNPGNFTKRPTEEVREITPKGGRASHGANRGATGDLRVLFNGGEDRTLFKRFIFGVECPLVSAEPLGM